MTERVKEVYVIVDQHTGEVYGSRFFLSEDHAVIYIQDRGYRYDAMANLIMPAKLVWKSDR